MVPNARTIPSNLAVWVGPVLLVRAQSMGMRLFFEGILPLAAAGIRLAMMACKPGEFPKPYAV